MAILTALQSASVRLLGRRPATFFGALPSAVFEMEIADLANEVAIDIAKYQDWQELVTTTTITGTGTDDAFPLPADYDRMLLVSDVQDLQSWAWGYYPYGDINGFLLAQSSGFSGHPGGWIIYGGEFRFSPAPATGATATFPYISANYARSEDATPKPAFTADTDTFVLPERLLTLGLIWRWRENKKLDASGDQEAFIKALDEYAAKDKGSRVIRRSSRRAFPGTHTAWPWALG